MEKKDIKTFKDVLAWTIELSQQMAENDKRWAESRQQMAENDKRWAESRQQMAENDKRWAESRQKFEEERKQMAKKEAIEKIQREKEREKERKYWDAKNHEVNKRIAEVTGTLGDAAEFEFVQAIDNNNKICAGIQFDIIIENMKGKREYDIILINGEYIGLIEVKWQADIKDIRKLVYKQAHDFREEMPIYKEKKLILFIASHVYNKKIATYANKLGVCFLYEKGQTLQHQYIEPLQLF